MSDLKPSEVRSIRLVLPDKPAPQLVAVADVLRRKLAERCGPLILASRQPSFTITLLTRPDLPTESFLIESDGPNALRIIGAEPLGVLFGIGKLLRTSSFHADSFAPGAWRGASAPKCRLRAPYLATHVNNYYEEAPIDDVVHYVQDLALWGYNSLFIHFPLWQYNGIDDPAAGIWLKRFKTVMNETKKCGMRVGLLQNPNGGYKNTPPDFLRTNVPGHRRGNFGFNLCPSKPAARRHLLKIHDALWDQFLDQGLDYFELFPYDEGGCACPDCWPWGARGYLSISREFVDHFRSRFPASRIILSTWCYENENDANPDGEWAGLEKALAQDKSWIDFIQADGHHDYFPKYILDHGVPGGLPLLNFPEISMFHMTPWGGYGTNPAPAHFQRLWDRIKHIDDGGCPYSEGIYEDLNKAIVAGFYWDPERKAADTVREYVSSEYSPDHVDDLARVVDIFEQNHCRDRIGDSASLAFDIVEKVDRKLAPAVRAGWRWRIFYLRALIDKEMRDRAGKLEGEPLKNAFDELTRLYYAENATYPTIRPLQIK